MLEHGLLLAARRPATSAAPQLPIGHSSAGNTDPANKILSTTEVDRCYICVQHTAVQQIHSMILIPKPT
jgi:hypothetical protein